MAAWAEMFVFLGLLTALTPALGGYLAAVFEGGPTSGPRRILGSIEAGVYRVCRIDPTAEMNWSTYLLAVALFTIVSGAVLFLLLITQQWLPLNPQHFANLPPLLALNVTISFLTTTNWQAYSGESTLSYLSQMMGLAWQNFVAAAVGLAAVFAVIRGFTRSYARTLGNFWVDLTRSLLYVLVPISIVGAIILVSQGTPQNFAPYVTATTVEGAHQMITGGPMASQAIIEQLGVNGGGFVGANAASPNQNPTPLTDFVQFLAMFLIGAGLTNAFGRLVGDTRQRVDDLRRDGDAVRRRIRSRVGCRASRESARASGRRRGAEPRG